MGLTAEQINRLTNHLLDKQYKAYQSQACWEVRTLLYLFELLLLCNKCELCLTLL
jgi:hypothetical protein